MIKPIGKLVKESQLLTESAQRAFAVGRDENGVVMYNNLKCAKLLDIIVQQQKVIDALYHICIHGDENE